MNETAQGSAADVAAFIAAIDHDRKREEALRPDALFREISGFEPARRFAGQ